MFDLSTYLADTFADVERSQDDLRPEQCEAIEFAWNTPFSALYCDVGAGKTAATLTVIDRLLMQGYTDKILIIAPIRVATRVWPYEPRLWSHLAYMRMTVIRIADDDPRLKTVKAKERTALKARLRSELAASDTQIHVINQEAVDWLVEEWAKRKRWPYKVVVFDEASRLRDHKSVVFRALKRVLPRIERFHQLTATPASQHYMNLFSQIFLLDKGERFGKHITPFRERYFTYNQWAHRWKLREGADKEIERLISDICLVQRRERDFQIVSRNIQLPKQLLDDYQEFERDLVLSLPDGVDIDAINAAVLNGKLLQFASGSVYDNERVAHDIHDEKIEELRQFIDETLDEPVIISYWFKSSLRRLKAAFPSAIAMDREGTCVDAWNRKEIKLLLLHPQSAAHGLNLQYGGRYIVLFDLFYSLELMTQLVGRLDRPGQTETVSVHMLCATGTIDETVAANLQHLRSAEEAMFRRLQELRRKYKG